MSELIHPTAIIHPSAKIGPGVEIGPYCIIGEQVSLGEGTVLKNHVVIEGPTQVGKQNLFYAFSSIGQRTQDLKYSKEPTYLEIGDHNTFREFCTVNRGTLPEAKTIIGSHNNFLAYCHIAHDCIVGNHVIFSNNGTLAGHVIVEDYVILGGLTAVHQFCRIGKHSITGGCSKIVQDVPPFTIVDGNPARARAINMVGLQRRGFSEEVIKSVRHGFKTLYRSKLNYSQALEQLAATEGSTVELTYFADFVRNSERGVVSANRNEA